VSTLEHDYEPVPLKKEEEESDELVKRDQTRITREHGYEPHAF
jgi:hypothetical protein